MNKANEQQFNELHSLVTTENTLDDQAVAMIKQSLFPGE